MNKAILISIKPKWVTKILNGEKTIEIRKTYPKQLRGDTPIKPEPIDVYIYCTKDEKNLLHKNCIDIYWVEDKDFKSYNKKLGLKTQPYLNGKVVAKFTLNKVEEYELWREVFDPISLACVDTIPLIYGNHELLRKSCLSEEQLYEYFANNSIKQPCYAWHIDNLVIFDEPKELSEFKRCTEKTCIYGKCHKYMHCLKPLTKAPQSWCYVEVENE